MILFILITIIIVIITVITIIITLIIISCIIVTHLIINCPPSSSLSSMITTESLNHES